MNVNNHLSRAHNCCCAVHTTNAKPMPTKAMPLLSLELAVASTVAEDADADADAVPLLPVAGDPVLVVSSPADDDADGLDVPVTTITLPLVVPLAVAVPRGMLCVCWRLGKLEYVAVVLASSSPSKPRLTACPSLSVMPPCRQVSVVPSTTARPVVPATADAVMVVPDNGRIA